MANWLESRQQTYEYYIVDPSTWGDKKLITTVKSCTINRDSEVETLGSASFEITENIAKLNTRLEKAYSLWEELQEKSEE